MRYLSLISWRAFGSVFLGFLGGAAFVYWLLSPSENIHDGEVRSLPFTRASSSTGTVSLFGTAAERAIPSVVYIHSTHEIQDEHDFFGVAELLNPGTEVHGSGVIISSDGYIVTNYHVIENANKIWIRLSDHRLFEAEIIGRDKHTDLAVLRIDAPNLKPIQFTNSDAVKVGEWALAIGSPFNLHSTVTAGIVSGKGRCIGAISQQVSDPSEYTTESFIQTDAAVNPGNSGGALVNIDGQLIGINTAIASQTGNFFGYSFAIPANIVQKITTDIIKYGLAQRGFVGISVQDVDEDIAQEKHLPSVKGAYVVSINSKEGQPATGIKVGDIIVGVRGKLVSSVAEIQGILALYTYGDLIELSLLRGNGLVNLKIPLKKETDFAKKVIKNGETQAQLI